jgi:hypothetical protein
MSLIETRREQSGPIPAVPGSCVGGSSRIPVIYLGRRRVAATRADLMTIKAVQLALQQLSNVVVPGARQAV